MAEILKEENKRRPSPVNPFATSSQEGNSPGPLDDAAAGAAASARGGQRFYICRSGYRASM